MTARMMTAVLFFPRPLNCKLFSGAAESLRRGRSLAFFARRRNPRAINLPEFSVLVERDFSSDEGGSDGGDSGGGGGGGSGMPSVCYLCI